MLIVGAGLSGLIAASMLRDQCWGLLEQQSSLPNNHSALLRFKTSVVGDAVGIPFRKVRVMKAVDTWLNPVADAMMYSLKATGKAELRSVTTAAGEIEERFIAPEDFIQRLANQLGRNVDYDKTISDAISFAAEHNCKIISTIPMPKLMDVLGWEGKPEFGYVGGDVITCDLPPNEVNACVTVYLPSPEVLPYRVSITDHRLIIEISHATTESSPLTPEGVEVCIRESLQALGLGHLFAHAMAKHTHKQMKYAKITPIDEGVRKRFIMWASSEFGIYSLGRFATWRPGLLLDDLVNDVRVIQRIAQNPGETYAHQKKG
jgi:hypothetical protein